MNIRKIEIYDDFRCIADHCNFTCCKGWDIQIDPDTLIMWRNTKELTSFVESNIKLKKSKHQVSGLMKLGKMKECPFLEQDGLCRIVKTNGEEFLSDTCRTFPRLENSFHDEKEYSLSCACPVVVDKLYSFTEPILFEYISDCISDNKSDNRIDINIINILDNKFENLSLEYKLRELMLFLLRQRQFNLKDRLLFIHHMLLSIKAVPDNLANNIQNYQKEAFLFSIKDIWNDNEMHLCDTLQELNELFLDITYHYSKEKMYSHYLKDIYRYASEIEVDELSERWIEFLKEFQQYDLLMENVITTKIFANCVSDDIDEMIMSFQLAVTEYTMTKYSAYLLWLNRAMKYPDIRDYIVTYTRIIGYNSEGIKEFWENSFENPIWELGYLLLLLG